MGKGPAPRKSSSPSRTNASTRWQSLDDPTRTADDDAWRQTLEQPILPDLLADPDVARYCNNIKKPDGSPVPGILISFSSTIHHSDNFFGLPGAPGDHGYSPSNFSTKISSAGTVLKGYVGVDPYAIGTPNAGEPDTADSNALRATPYMYFIPCGNDPAFFYSTIPAEFTNRRLFGRSVWNGQWKLVIPAYSLLDNEQDGLNRFVRSVKDIQLFLRTYSHSGN